jgi:predicted nucleic acid-binding protein
MRLVVDASVLVAEVLRARGRTLLSHPELDLVVPTEMWSETEHEMRNRVDLMVSNRHMDQSLAAEILDQALATINARVILVDRDVYAGELDEARRRVPGDPRDAPVVALALTLDCGIWTNDRDFFGCGLPVWNADTLRLRLQ